MIKCGEVMRHPLGNVTPTSDLRSVARAMRDEQVGFFPVLDESGRAVGVVTDRDIVLRACADGLPLEQTSVSSIMSRDIVTCRPEDELSVAIELMKTRQKSRIIVSDEAGRTRGVLSITDIAQYAEPVTASGLFRTVCAREFRLAHASG